jgi:hypothetical protein
MRQSPRFGRAILLVLYLKDYHLAGSALLQRNSLCTCRNGTQWIAGVCIQVSDFLRCEERPIDLKIGAGERGYLLNGEAQGFAAVSKRLYVTRPLGLLGSIINNSAGARCSRTRAGPALASEPPRADACPVKHCEPFGPPTDVPRRPMAASGSSLICPWNKTDPSRTQPKQSSSSVGQASSMVPTAILPLRGSLCVSYFTF